MTEEETIDKRKMHPQSTFIRFMYKVFDVIDKPVTYFREKIVEPNQREYYFYHRRFRRVPTLDECYTDDAVCHAEAQLQFLRDKSVDEQILGILRNRWERCVGYHHHEQSMCKSFFRTYEENLDNFDCKYDEIDTPPRVRIAFMKQKHRLIWERRHGRITGRGGVNPIDV